MKKASILAQLENNKAEILTLEECFMGELSQEDSTDLLAELKALMNERYIHMQALTALMQSNLQDSSVRFFPPKPVDLSDLENLAILEHECTLEAENMISDLILRFENYEITSEMYHNGQAAIKYELQNLNATTIEQFKTQTTTAIDQAFTLSSPQASCS